MILNKKDLDHIIHDAFCNSTGVYGAVQLSCKRDEYNEAKERLIARTNNMILDKEDVWLEILHMGKTLYLVDIETEEKHSFNYDSIRSKLSSDNKHLVKMILESLSEHSDAATADTNSIYGVRRYNIRLIKR